MERARGAARRAVCIVCTNCANGSAHERSGIDPLQTTPLRRGEGAAGDGEGAEGRGEGIAGWESRGGRREGVGGVVGV